MAEVLRITEPALLSDITIGLSSLSIESSEPSQSASQTRPVELALLQPLANADTLAACRAPGSRVTVESNEPDCISPNFEYLDIRPLSVAWRQALMKVAPISHLTFDLTLPRRDESTGAPLRVCWQASPRVRGFNIREQDVMTLVTTLATGTKMRAKGDVQFGVTYDETEGVSVRAMEALKKGLLALAEYKAPETTPQLTVE